MKISGFIPCAGFGTRMGDLTESLPKPLLPVNGVPMIYHTLFLFHLWNVRRIFINLHYLPDRFTEELKNYPYAELIFSHEPEILGTAGGIRSAVREEGVSLIVKNPDALHYPSFAILNDIPALLRDSRASLLYLLPKAKSSTETGLDLIENGSSYGSVVFADTGRFFFAGISFLNTDSLADLNIGTKEELGTIWKRASAGNTLFGKRYEGIYIDVGSRQKYLEARSMDIIPDTLKGDWQKFLSGLGR
jgi:MurNAc alpha-1-phosphate uridylyltransferase